MSTVEERTGISLHWATELVQDRDKCRKIVLNVGAHVRPTQLKKKWSVQTRRWKRREDPHSETEI